MSNFNMNAVSGLFNKFLVLLTLVIFGAIFVFSWEATSQFLKVGQLNLSSNTANLVIAMGVIIYGLIIFLISSYVKKLSQKTFLIVMLSVAFLLRFIWILVVDTPIQSDFNVLYTAAVDASKGDFSFSQTPYFLSWVYQIGFTMYQALVLSIFDGGAFVLKLLNVIYGVGTVFLVYKIGTHVFNEAAGRVAGVFYSLYLPSIFMTSVLTNQYIAIILFYAGFYLLVKNGVDHKSSWFFIGILLSLGDIMRPLGAFILVALFCYMFLQFISSKKDRKKTVAKKFIGIVAVFYLLHYGVSFAFMTADVTDYPLSNRNPMWKFVLGFNHETVGQYSTEDSNFMTQYTLGKERTEAEKELIKERLEDKDAVVDLMWNKSEKMWGDLDASIKWSVGYQGQSFIHNIFYVGERIMYMTIAIGSILGLLYSLIRKSNMNQSLFLLLIIGYICIHFLIEIQTRYRFFIIPSFIIIGSYGFSLFVESKKVKSQKEKLSPPQEVAKNV
ncbi:ArnT family glycosyltransferase [Priestia filamentosa]|uniref:Glycosyltransferase RgtA/B/C/D-like domain-containing protein n=1 Tax=Priestia filamentosa TaxID=1402861 RepID=A0A1X7FRQ1_9BACI|nr:glycosyltransferase family 39 protein [Priestia filamentosa]AKO94746.1 hypothetical protein BEH_23200 [Priestia filamentosa]MDT3765064.1 glycosyltransferase family 39 protein [Priestia filamentosa]OXS66773.1 hypothetical protein B1B01_18920 [Priestia filamentosa]RJS66143.1 hypothetical protein CJ485_16050 [Priestia filamentosa]WCM15651.1 glycosyltransferase family 39 protein [Priestia filamentosa]